MPKKDKYKPWVAGGFVALVFATIGRYVALQGEVDAGTANLIFLIVFLGIMVLYVGITMLLEILLNPLFKKKKTDNIGKQSKNEEKAARPQLEQTQEAIAEEVSELPADSLLQKKIEAFCNYTDNVLAGYVALEDLPLLHKYIEQYAHNNLGDIPQQIKTHTVDTFDLCHYGWNIWNHFGKVVGQEETAEWLKKIFEHFKEISPNTIHKKFTHRERMTYTIPLEDDIK